MPHSRQRLCDLGHSPIAPAEAPRACIQLGGVCQGTEQNQTRNIVLCTEPFVILGIPKSVVE